MIVIHRGKGFAVPIIGILSALAMNVASTARFDDNYYADHTWPKIGTIFLASILTFAAGAYLRKYPTKPKPWIKEHFDGESKDHFFYIPVIFWSGIFFALGLACLIFALFPIRK